MKILFGMPEKSAHGGINACEIPFLRELENLGIEIHEEIYCFDNPVQISVFQRVSQVIKTAFKFRRILREENFDLFHINTSFDKKALLRDAFIVYFIRQTNTKIFVKFHGSDKNILKSNSFIMRGLIKYLAKNVDGIGVLSSEEKQNFINQGLSEDKFYIVKNALTELPENNIERDFSISKNKPFQLLFVARLIRAKGLQETIQAVSKLDNAGFNIALNVLGDGEFRKAAENLVKKLRKTKIVNFYGHVNEKTVQKFYQESHSLIFPTFHCEGFPMVIFNSMGNGLPIITTKIRAAADYLKDEENCLFCEAKNPEDVAEKITKLYNKPCLMRQISENNFKLAKKFAGAIIAKEYLEIYRKLI